MSDALSFLTVCLFRLPIIIIAIQCLYTAEMGIVTKRGEQINGGKMVEMRRVRLILSRLL